MSRGGGGECRDRGDDSDDTDCGTPETEGEDTGLDSSLPHLAYRESDWSVDRTADDVTALEPGETVAFEKRFSDEDVRSFAGVSGDTNRLHLDARYAEETRFGGRIIHGALLSGLISAALARLPGQPITISQDVEFLAPARPGTTLRSVCEVVEDVGGGTYRLRTRVVDETDEVLVDGEAVVLLDDTSPVVERR